MNRPSFQFYPKDWRNNANLGRCSFAARGAWLEVMCVLHDSDEYGLVRWPLKELSNSAKVPMPLLRELVDKSVLKGSEKEPIDAYVYVPRSGRKDGAPVTLIGAQPGPLWYSSRMVKDEYVRTIRGESTRFGEDNGDAPSRSPSRAPKPTKGDGASSFSSSSSPRNGRRTSEDLPRALVEGETPEPTLAGRACLACRGANVLDANPSHPDLLRLLEAGVTPEEIGATAAECAAKGKGRFAYVLRTIERRRIEAAGAGPVPQHSPATVPSNGVAETDAYLASQRLTPEQRAKADIARKAAMAAIGRVA